MPDYFYPNKMGRILLMALEEVVGRTGSTAVLNQAGLAAYIDSLPVNDLELKVPFSHLGQMQTSLEQLYGPRGGRGVALRVGRATFRHGLREFGPLVGVTDLTFRLKPQEARLREGALSFAQVFNRFTDQRVRVEEKADCFLWIIERCPVCWERQTDRSACHLAVGLLQEALHWATGGKYFPITETSCAAAGSQDCIIQIDKQPTD